MEFKDIILSLAVIAIGIFAFLGLATTMNESWGTSIGDDFSEDYENLRVGLVGNVTERGDVAGEAGTPAEGQAPGDSDESLAGRALRVLSTLPELAGMPLKLIGTAGTSLGIPPFITLMAQAVFIFSFFMTLAYIFITGTRRVLGR